MTRVLFVLGTTSAGGAENQCRYLLGALRSSGVELEFVCFQRGRAHERFAALGIPIHVVQRKLPVTVDWYRRSRHLRHLIGARQPDILHSWLYEAHLVGVVASRSWPETRVLLSHRSTGVLPRERKFVAAMRLLSGRIDHVVANSDVGTETFTATVGIDPRRVSVISNGIPDERVSVRRGRDAVRQALGIRPDVPVICSVGRIDHENFKDYPTLFAAMRHVWSALPDSELIIVGPTSDAVERKVGIKLPPRVHVLGWQPEPPEWMNAADVVAVHSRAIEGHSNAAGEALMLGLPVATTDVGGHPALVRRAGGRVVPIRRGDLLGEAILALIHHPPSRDRVIQVARDELSIENVADAYLDIYDRLLSPSGV